MNAPMTVSQIRQSPSEMATVPDQAVDMFTERGFMLANRIAKAFASSDAVPAQFRTHNLKKVNQEEHWVENPAAAGNCLVAIEVARAVGMSITAVMQNADMIEGKLRWSGKFVIAAINASGRFTPLRFQMVNKGPIEAAYKEKTGWDNAARRPIFTERKVNVDNIECIAWALPRGFAEPRPTPEQMRAYQGRMLDLYRDMGMPVIESAPVTMKLAVEEGWYAKAGSKWQTELRHLMFQYRAGSYFGNIHAPDIVMGMGPTTEEIRDTQVIDMGQDGSYTVTTEALRQDMPRVDVDGVITNAPSPSAQQTNVPKQQAEPVAQQATATAAQTSQKAEQPSPTTKQQPPAFDLDAFATRLDTCQSLDALDVMADEVSGLERDQVINEDQAQTLLDVYRRRRQALTEAPAATQQTTTRRRTSSAAGTAPE